MGEKKKKKLLLSCQEAAGERPSAGQRLAAGSRGPEAASTHHVLLRGVLVALEDSDPVPAAHVLDLSHRLVPEFLQGRGVTRSESSLHRASKQAAAPDTSLEVHLPRHLG